MNGQVVQDARLEQMIFDVPRQIEYCSSFTRLEPGDVIATGTPGGGGAQRPPPRWGRHGHGGLEAPRVRVPRQQKKGGPQPSRRRQQSSFIAPGTVWTMRSMIRIGSAL